jgi:hypothetical protein
LRCLEQLVYACVQGFNIDTERFNPFVNGHTSS